MMIVNDWRLTPGFLAFIDVIGSEKRIYLASRDKKADRNAVAKLLQDRPFTEITSDLNELELKFEKLSREWTTSSVGTYVRNSEIFPDDSWYRVMNFYDDQITDIFLSLDSKKGTFEGKVFEAIFSESNPSVVSFVCSDMPEYKIYLEEMRRRINCEINKKTKKWVPGHRYDTIKETYYFLGTFASRKSALNNSEFKENLEMATAYLYTNIVYDSDKSITDIIKTRCFGDKPEDIKVIFSLPSAVESGEVLEDDLSGVEIQKYWDVMLDNAVKACSVNKSKDYIGYHDTYKIFEIFSYFSSWGKLDYPKEITDKLKDILKNLAFDTLIEWYGVQRSDNNLNILPGKEDDDNIKSIERNLYGLTRDPNISRTAFYQALLGKMGINITDIIRDVFIDWKTTELVNDFNDYLKYSFYFDRRNNDYELTSRQRVNTTSYHIDAVPIKSILGPGVLTKSVIDLVDFARNNHGSGVSKYAVYNVGTIKSPKEYISCELTLNDLLSYIGEDSITDELKSEIIGKKFTRIVVQVDKDKELE